MPEDETEQAEDLTLASTSALIKELKTRGRTTFIAWVPFDQKELEWSATWKSEDGSVMPVLGLIEMAKMQLTVETTKNSLDE